MIFSETEDLTHVLNRVLTVDSVLKLDHAVEGTTCLKLGSVKHARFSNSSESDRLFHQVICDLQFLNLVAGEAKGCENTSLFESLVVEVASGKFLEELNLLDLSISESLLFKNSAVIVNADLVGLLVAGGKVNHKGDSVDLSLGKSRVVLGKASVDKSSEGVSGL